MARIEVTGGDGRWEARDGRWEARDGRWEARDGRRPVGVLRAYTRPDRRTFLAFRDCRDDAYRPLLLRAAADLRRPALYTTVDERDGAGLRRLGRLGFVVNRQDHHYRVPVDPTRLRLANPVPPPGIALVTAADADLDRLRHLDDALRNDTPGADGWRWDPQEFREETFSDGFDPATYLIAVEEETGEYVGLMRLWMRSAGPRFGFIGLLPRWRRTRVTYTLLSTVFQEVRRRGHRTAAAEIDATNRPSNGIATRAGAVRVGGSHELVRVAGTGGRLH